MRQHNHALRKKVTGMGLVSLLSKIGVFLASRKKLSGPKMGKIRTNKDGEDYEGSSLFKASAV